MSCEKVDLKSSEKRLQRSGDPDKCSGVEVVFLANRRNQKSDGLSAGLKVFRKTLPRKKSENETRRTRKIVSAIGSNTARTEITNRI